MLFQLKNMKYLLFRGVEILLNFLCMLVFVYLISYSYDNNLYIVGVMIAGCISIHDFLHMEVLR